MSRHVLPDHLEGRIRFGSDCIETPLLRHFLRCWLTIRPGPDGVPAREDLDPIRLGPELLPVVWIVERDAEGEWRYRLVGEQINELHGYSLRGKSVTDVFGAARRRTVGPRWSFCVDAGYALRTYGNIYGPQKVYSGERLVLPLIGRRGGAAMLLGATVGRYQTPAGPSPGGSGFRNFESDWIPLSSIPLPG